jgi:hypothetical protein
MLNKLLQYKNYYEQIQVLGRQVSSEAANYLNAIIK